jgi:outer membrane murein-binding lipoprotein Lpp
MQAVPSQPGSETVKSLLKAAALPVLLLAAGCNVNVDNKTEAQLDNVVSDIESGAENLAAGVENVAEDVGNQVDQGVDAIDNKVDVNVDLNGNESATTNKQ